jgi:hypothetical protein
MQHRKPVIALFAQILRADATVICDVDFCFNCANPYA